MDRDAKLIARVLVDAFNEHKREEHKNKMASKVVAIGQSGVGEPVYIKDYQKAAIHQLLMEFYRIMHRDSPSTLFSDIEKNLLKKFKVKSLDFLTMERFDQVVMNLLNDISSYDDSPFNGDKDYYAEFSVKDSTNAYMMTSFVRPRNVVTYLLGNHLLLGEELAN
jgi:hypothetical protein